VSEIKVDTTPTKEVMVDSLTRDASVEACIYDLIDNSIDSARAILQKEQPDSIDEFGQPHTYEGYRINITINPTEVLITDNCGGIDVEELSMTALRFGGSLEKKHGIGLYGVGLKRAIYKLGKNILIRSIYDGHQAELAFNVDDYLKSNEWKLPARVSSTSEKSGTTVNILNPPIGVRNVIGDSNKVDFMQEEISRLYYLFLQKGLSIFFNGTKLIPEFVEIRKDSPFPILTRTIPFNDDVTIQLMVGQHIKHRFTAEPSYTKNNNKNLTQDYGWTVICNDRPVIQRNRESITGWGGTFHTEFYGFVGYARFYSQNAISLPWNTSKTGIDLSNNAYQVALAEMEKLTKKWRSFSRVVKEAKKNGEPLLPGQLDDKLREIEEREKREKDKKDKPNPKPKKLWAVLPQDIDTAKCSDKLCDIILEAQTINIKRNRYLAAAIMRMLFEMATLDYLLKHKKTALLKRFIMEQKNQKREKDGLKRKRYKMNNISPTLQDICNFLNRHPEEWGGHAQSSLKKSLADFMNRKNTLNSALHDPMRRTGEDKIVGIRDELLPILRHFIEHTDYPVEETT